jgi:nucleoside-diphosphate-sugar epimerase
MNTPVKKIILTGGAGLVGHNLVILLKQKGFSNLVVLDKHATNLDILKKNHPEVIAEYADLAEPGDWQSHFIEAEAVIMLQAQIGDLKAEPFIRNNIHSTEHVLEAMKQHRVPYLIHISSSVVESVADDLYTKTKKEQERIVLDSGIDCTVLRPTLMFGWFDRKHLGWLARFMHKVPLFPIPGSGRYVRQPLYAGDFAAIVLSCIEKNIKGKVFNITGLEKIAYIDIIRAIKRSTRAKSLIINIPYGLFYALLETWSIFDKNPPFTVEQLTALVAHDEFEIIDWPNIFEVEPTPFNQAIDLTFNHPVYSNVALEF